MAGWVAQLLIVIPTTFLCACDDPFTEVDEGVFRDLS